jgi:hypothetical protein
VGIVFKGDEGIRPIEDIGEACVDVRWIWVGVRDIEDPDNQNLRSLTLCEELDPDVQRLIVDLLIPAPESVRA